MTIYQTNAALGHQEYAYLIKLEQKKDKADYLVIATNLSTSEFDHSLYSDPYVAGEVVQDLEDYYVEESTYDVTSSPLYGTFLFMYFLKTKEN